MKNFFKRTVAKIFGFDHEINSLETRIKRIEKTLSIDDAFGILNRNALMRFSEAQPPGIIRYLVMIDLDHLHDMNERFGYIEVNRRVRKLFQTLYRMKGTVVGKLFSGDEILVITGIDHIDALTVLDKLKRASSAYGLSFTSVIGKWHTSWNLFETATRLADQVLENKRKARVPIR